MDNRILKPGVGNEVLTKENRQGKDVSKEDVSQLREMSQAVSEGVNVLSEGQVEEGGAFSETEKKPADQGVQSSGGKQKMATGSAVKQLPPVEVMIRQTVEAIESELKNTENEVKAMIKSKKASPQVLNDKVRRIRFLNGLMSQMKKAAKMAEDFIVNLWKQFVGKSS